MGQRSDEDRQDWSLALPSRELRTTYHDRIAAVRERSVHILRCTIAGIEWATGVLTGDISGRDHPAGCPTEEMQALAAAVDAEVVDLLALESPMARDLRVILTSRDVAQIGLLCVGLCAALAARVERAAAALTPELRGLVGAVGSATEELFRRSDAAWAGLDVEVAAAVERAAAGVRGRQREFITALLDLDGVAMEAALDLAMVARAFERLADHAVEISERVDFAVNGTPSTVPTL